MEQDAPRGGSVENDPNIGRMLLLVGLAILALAVLQIILTLPGGVDAEDFLYSTASDLR